MLGVKYHPTTRNVHVPKPVMTGLRNCFRLTTEPERPSDYGCTLS